jgi:hypothetical protein
MTSKLSEWKTIRIPCKQCAKEFDFKCPLKLYEALRAAAEKDGEDVIFTDTCPECRKDDPFLAAMDKYGIRTLGNNKGSSG